MERKVFVDLSKRMADISEHIMEYLPKHMVERHMDKWSRELLLRMDESNPLYMVSGAIALAFAMDLATFTPSATTHKIAPDRLLKSGALKDAKQIEAARLLRDSQLRVVEALEDSESGFTTAKDMATEEHVSLVVGDGFMVSKGDIYLLRTCPYAEKHVVCGMRPVFMDDGALMAARSFMREGKGIVNPLRCAEAVYGYVLLHGNPLRGIDMDSISEMFSEDGEFPFSEKDGVVHALAQEWSQSGSLPEPDENVRVIIRDHCVLNDIYDVADAACCANSFKLDSLAAAYDRILFLQLEVTGRRDRAGLSTARNSLEFVLREFRDGESSGEVSREMRERVESVVAKVRLAFCNGDVTGKANMAMSELDKLLARIKALRSKTVDQGCTEEEAMLAAEKVAELLDRYGLSLSEMELKQQQCIVESMETGRRQQSALDGCIASIAEFCDCRTWFQSRPDNRLAFVFFGLPADVTGARVLYEKIEQAFNTETEKFKRGDAYLNYPSGMRRRATSSFQLGMQEGICGKLHALKRQRSDAMRKTGGRDLVPLKRSVIEEELAAMGMNFRSKSSGRSRMVLSDAYSAGEVSAQTIRLEEHLEKAG